MKKKSNKKIPLDQVLIDLITSGLEKDMSQFEFLSLMVARTIKNDEPNLSKKIINLLSSYTLNRNTRSFESIPLPLDKETQLEMARVVTPNADRNPIPVLSPILQEKIEGFIEERKNVEALLDKNIRPPTSLLLIGPSGTGKTMLARHIASALDKNLVILDLSTSISSFLGRTGHNLKRVLDYARHNAAVLLLDEFDAIAKKRDDITDLGEIKRVVNVLLMELESWPASSVVIGTSNHPELLDKAIWRRFDHTLELGFPAEAERMLILTGQLKDFITDDKEQKIRNTLRPISMLLKERSPADVCRFAEMVKRRMVIRNEDLLISCVHSLELFTENKKIKGEFCALAKNVLGEAITVRELSRISGLSPSGIQHHISKQKYAEQS